MSQDHIGNRKSLVGMVECGFAEQLRGNQQEGAESEYFRSLG